MPDTNPLHVPVWDDEHRYIVEGRGVFPFDMLRRDRSFPYTEADAMLLAPDNAGHRRVQLVATRARDVCVKRWASFGWQVVAGFAETYPMPLIEGEPWEASKHGNWEEVTLP